MDTIKRPNRDALSDAIDIYRDAMRPFITSAFERVYGSTTQSAIRNALPDHLAITFEEVLQEGGDLESTIDVNSFPLLVQRKWPEVFSAYFRGRRTIQNELWLISKARDYVCHPWTQDLSAEYTRARLYDIAGVLGRINAPDQKRAVETISAQIADSTPVGVGVESRAISARVSRQSARGKTTVTGYVNPNDQKNLGRVVPERKNLGNGQYMYRMKCRKCHGKYNCWGGDIHHHRCPYCDGGAPGLDPSEGEFAG